MVQTTMKRYGTVALHLQKKKKKKNATAAALIFFSTRENVIQ